MKYVVYNRVGIIVDIVYNEWEAKYKALVNEGYYETKAA